MSVSVLGSRSSHAGKAQAAVAIYELAWPSSRLGEGLVALGRVCRLGIRTEETPPGTGLDRASPAWFQAAARWLGIEAVALEVPHPELGDFLRSSGPAIVGLTTRSGERKFLLLTGNRFGRASVLGEDGELHGVSRNAIALELDSSVSSTARTEVDRLLRKTALTGERRARVHDHMVRERLHDEVITDIWLLRESPGSLKEDVARSGLSRLVIRFGGVYTLDYFLFTASWWLLGWGALAGQIDWGWLYAWALIFVTMLPIRAASTWYEGRIAVAAGSLLRKRLLHGAMRLRPDEMRRDGVGRHLSRVNESQTVESLALDGGLLSLAACVELLVCLGILALGAGGIWHSLLLLLTIVAFGSVGLHHYRKRTTWMESRLSISHDLVERMVGHRTRLAQERPERWHDGEDAALATYIERSRAVDRPYAYLITFERIWLPIGILGLAPVFIGGGLGIGPVAVGLGGIILAGRAFRKLGVGFANLMDSVLAWKQVAQLSDAASRRQWPGDPSLVAASATPLSAESGGRSRDQRSDSGSSSSSDSGRNGQGRLEANDVSFTYPRRAEPVLTGVNVKLEPSDCVLLTSPSGGGKSTLVSILNGLREPDSGMVLLGGVDRPSLGAEAWTRRIATAPQFHENHVFTETFAFNVLMGRRWPPTSEDWGLAKVICSELGLGDLLEKMPGEMNQMIGDTGWQLSHGERSRLFLARALLQGGDVVLLDESFGALDPDNLRQALITARQRAKSLVVIAHP
jgi:ATP-binding cassette subfamily B protein